MANEHVAKILVVPGKQPGIPTMVKSKTRESFYYGREAISAAVCIALEETVRAVARGEIEAGDGFTVRVEFVSTKET